MQLTVDVRDPALPCISNVMYFAATEFRPQNYVYLQLWEAVDTASWTGENRVLWRSDDGGQTWWDASHAQDIEWSLHGSLIRFLSGERQKEVMFQIEIKGLGRSNIVTVYPFDSDDGGDHSGDRDGGDRVKPPVLALEDKRPESEGVSSGNVPPSGGGATPENSTASFPLQTSSHQSASQTEPGGGPMAASSNCAPEGGSDGRSLEAVGGIQNNGTNGRNASLPESPHAQSGAGRQGARRSVASDPAPPRGPALEWEDQRSLTLTGQSMGVLAAAHPQGFAVIKQGIRIIIKPEQLQPLLSCDEVTFIVNTGPGNRIAISIEADGAAVVSMPLDIHIGPSVFPLDLSKTAGRTEGGEQLLCRYQPEEKHLSIALTGPCIVLLEERLTNTGSAGNQSLPTPEMPLAVTHTSHRPVAKWLVWVLGLGVAGGVVYCAALRGKRSGKTTNG